MCPHLLERSDVDGGSAIGHEALGEAHASERQADGLLYTAFLESQAFKAAATAKRSGT